MSVAVDEITPQNVLDFWFGEIKSYDDAIDGSKIQSWFASDKRFDKLIESKYGEFMKEALDHKAFDEWKSSAKGLMALIIVSDQFTRNVFRNTPNMFAHDPYALQLCKEGMEKGIDVELFRMHPVYALFFYMPLMHSVDVNNHETLIEKSKGCIKALDEKHPLYGMVAKMWPKHIDQHADVIKQCGRYPQRNHILGRDTTEKEKEMIKKYNLMDLIDKSDDSN